MSKWKQFEIDCTNYLNDHFGNYATFIHEGSEDSTVPDIKVITKSGTTFYIEAKKCPAQCGQFVLLPDICTSTFIYSPLNAHPDNEYSQKITEHMNSQFEEFKEAGTSGKDIIFNNCTQLFTKWIIDNYKHRNTRFFITNGFKIIPIEEFANYFIPSAKYRIKRSGSSDVGKKSIPSVKKHLYTTDYIIDDMREDGSKLFVITESNYHNSRFFFNKYEYMFSERIREYEIRKLSNTFNANVIFRITEKNDLNGICDNSFISYLLS